MEDPKKPFWWPDPQSFIAITLVISLIAIAFILILRDHKLSEVVIGAFITIGFTTIVGYYFGSSKGSKEKDEALINRTPSPPPPPVSTTTTTTDESTVTKTEPQT